MYTNYEVKILTNETEVKKILMEISMDYEEDFLLDNIVFVTIDDSKSFMLNSIRQSIVMKEEALAYQL